MPATKVKRRFYGWVMLPVLCLVYSIPIGFAMYGPPVINTFMTDALKLQRWQVNAGYSIIGIVLGLGAIFLPWLMNRCGPKKTLTIGAVMIAIAGVSMALSGDILTDISGNSFPLIYWIICVLVGLGVCFGSIIPVQTLVLLWFNVHRALAMGFVLGGGAIGGFFYPQIISNCITAFGNDWRIGWYVIAIACFIGAVVALFAIRNRPEELGQHPDGLSPEQLEEAAKNTGHKLIRTYRSPVNWPVAAAFRTSSLWLIMASGAVVFFLWQLLITQAPAHLLDRGFSPSDPSLIMQPAFIYGLVLAFSVIGRMSLSFIGERIETRYIMSGASVMLVIGGILFWFASKEMLWAVFLFPVFAGIGFGATYVSLPLILGNYFGAGSFVEIMRVVNPVNAVLQFSAPAIAGLVYDSTNSYGFAILFACTIGLIGAGMFLICKPPPVKTA